MDRPMKIRVCVLVCNVSELVGLWNTNRASLLWVRRQYPCAQLWDCIWIWWHSLQQRETGLQYTPSENIIWPILYEEFNIKRKHYWAALRPQQCPQNVTFEDYSKANQWMKTRGSPWDTGFEEVWPPSSLDSNRKGNFCAAFLREMLTGPPTTRCSPWSSPSRRCWSTSPRRTSRGPTAGSGRGRGRPSLLRIIYSDKCQVYMKRNKYAKFHDAVIL